MSEIKEAVARALYECEAARSAEVARMLSTKAGIANADLMESWEEAADIFRGDADAALEAACNAIGWPQIHAFQDELRKGQSIYEDAGGFFARAIGALFGRKPVETVVTYQDAAKALIRHNAPTT